MNKDDIKKALLQCTYPLYCDDCPYFNLENRSCRNKLKIDAQNLIAEQEKEIERLESENANLTVENEVLQSEKENLMRTLEDGCDEIESARNETAKEILQEMKEKCKELEDKFSHICKSKKECLMETCRYEGVLAVKRELYELAKEYGVESVEMEE